MMILLKLNNVFNFRSIIIFHNGFRSPVWQQGTLLHLRFFKWMGKYISCLCHQFIYGDIVFKCLCLQAADIDSDSNETSKRMRFQNSSWYRSRNIRSQQPEILLLHLQEFKKHSIWILQLQHVIHKLLIHVL